ncbi:hypothetical protein SISNIDRAFT_459140 [Sistotremastrum niveocremeum HHB9708]|uniref:Swi5-domain-containing protein n=2 Tax=Sistotremastraceae TaxID=3402574 RepID=A0A164PY94_9AGAM|nr:hypothetical protein SISNIDRAFT_459140 [Sistotremastrum niveocremeum HHB9708]KZT33335.1 hypothetical protein SISSUDRAFT_1054358 [Sistotremastrum suecicum HHB10207 ss-3]
MSSKKTDIKARALALQAEIDELKSKLGKDVVAEVVVNKHIKLLHQYNEAKDATQILIGRLAAARQTTVKNLHEEYGLGAED